MEPASQKAIDALHAELLGDVALLLQKVDALKETLPQLTQATRGEAMAITEHLATAFDEFRQSSVSLVAYIKAKQLETMREVEASHGTMMDGARKSLQGFERVQWLLAGLAGCNFLLTLLLLGVHAYGLRP
jgi:DNA anti-recombination protein RmuC